MHKASAGVNFINKYERTNFTQLGVTIRGRSFIKLFWRNLRCSVILYELTPKLRVNCGKKKFYNVNINGNYAQLINSLWLQICC